MPGIRIPRQAQCNHCANISMSCGGSHNSGSIGVGASLFIRVKERPLGEALTTAAPTYARYTKSRRLGIKSPTKKPSTRPNPEQTCTINSHERHRFCATRHRFRAPDSWQPRSKIAQPRQALWNSMTWRRPKRFSGQAIRLRRWHSLCSQFMQQLNGAHFYHAPGRTLQHQRALFG